MENVGDVARALQEKWARKWGLPLEAPCTKCQSGALRCDPERPDRVMEYCDCSTGRWKKERTLQEYQEIMEARRASLFGGLRLPEGRAHHTIESYQAYLKNYELPTMPEHLRKVLQFVEHWDGKENLLLYGESGGGKTGMVIPLLKLLVARALDEGWDVKRFPHWYARYLRSVDFIKQLQNGFHAENPKERYAAIADEYANVPLLVFDDFGKGIYRASGDVSEFVAKEYFALFDARAGRLPTFITTNMTPAQIKKEFGDFLHGRIIEGTCIIKVEGANTRVLSALERNPDIDPAELGLMDEDAQEAPEKHLRVVGRD